MDLTYWYLFPLGIIISAVAMSAGISGANFWILVYLGYNPMKHTVYVGL